MTTFIIFALGIMMLLSVQMASAADAPSTRPTTQPGPTVPKGKVLFTDELKNFDNWQLEGITKDATIPEPGTMRLACTSVMGYEGVMAFCKKDFPYNIAIEFDFVAERHNGLFITFIGMKGVNGEDALTGVPKRTGVFEDYTGKKSTTRSYHVSICRYNDDGTHTGVSNWRRNPGLNLMVSGKDLCQEANKKYHVMLIKRGPHCRVEVDGQPGAEFVDPQKLPGPIPTDGKFGFRAIGAKAIFQVSNIKVTELE
jgi:hypothetical protein